MSSETEATITAWFIKRLPKDWFTEPASVDVDSDEILVVGTLAEGKGGREFREETREKRVLIAGEAEDTFGRKVSWGVRAGGETLLFTHLAAPAMTRLRMSERKVLDTLVAGGVARSRSEALAWCVRLVGKHEADWLKDLQDALVEVRNVRASGPAAL